MREFEWKFSGTEVRDFDDCPDTVIKVKVMLVLKDYDLDMVEMTDLSAVFDMPNTDNFIQYDDLTPEVLREWVIAFYSKGRENWLPNLKANLTAQLDARAATRSRVVRATLTDNKENNEH